MKLLVNINQIASIKLGINAPNSTEMVEFDIAGLDADLRDVFANFYNFRDSKLSLTGFEVILPITTEKINAAIRVAAAKEAACFLKNAECYGQWREIFKSGAFFTDKFAALSIFASSENAATITKKSIEIQNKEKEDWRAYQAGYNKIIEAVKSERDLDFYTPHTKSQDKIWLDGFSYPISEFPQEIRDLIDIHILIVRNGYAAAIAAKEEADKKARLDREAAEKEREAKKNQFLAAYIRSLGESHRKLWDDGITTPKKAFFMLKNALLKELGEYWFLKPTENQTISYDINDVIIDVNTYQNVEFVADTLKTSCEKLIAGTGCRDIEVKITQKLANSWIKEDETTIEDNLTVEFLVSFGSFIQFNLYRNITAYDILEKMD